MDTKRQIGALLLLLAPALGLGQPPADYGKPAPPWLREAGMFNGWYVPWTEEMLERIKGFPLVVSLTADRDIVAKLHARGVRVAFYTNFYAPFSSTAIEKEMRKRQERGEFIPPEWPLMVASPVFRIIDPARHPEWIWVGPDGYPRKKPASYEETYGENATCRQACPNAPGYREAVLEVVSRLMDMGVDGIFLDCMEFWHRKQCNGPKFGLHRHVDQDVDNNQVWLALQKKIYELVKSRGEDKVVLLNGGGGAGSREYLRYGDAYMLESYILTHVSTRRWHSWEQIQKFAGETGQAVKAGKVILALSYAGYTPNAIDEDAFYAYACARLHGYSWADWFTLADARSTLLYRLKLGAPRSEPMESNGILYKIFANGLVAVNPNYEDRELKVKTGFTFLRDVLNNRRYAPHDESKGMTLDTQELQAIIPGQAGRVFIAGF